MSSPYWGDIKKYVLQNMAPQNIVQDISTWTSLGVSRSPTYPPFSEHNHVPCCLCIPWCVYDMIYDRWPMTYMIYHIWHVICDMWYMIYGIWYMMLHDMAWHDTSWHVYMMYGIYVCIYTYHGRIYTTLFVAHMQYNVYNIYIYIYVLYIYIVSYI